MSQPPALPSAFSRGNVAVITGAASGIGLAAALRLAQLGMKVTLADLEGSALGAAAEQVAAVAGGAQNVLAIATDVSRADDLGRLRDATTERFGAVSVLMNN